MHLIATLIKWLKLFATYILQAIVGYIAVGLILAGGGAYLLTKIGLNLVIQLANIPTPIWATIALILLCYLHIYVKAAKTQVESEQIDPSSASPCETKYFTIDDYKWKVLIFKNGTIRVEEYPFCATHDLRFILGDDGKYCPHIENDERCNSHLDEHDEFAVCETAKSIIEKRIRDKEHENSKKKR